MTIPLGKPFLGDTLQPEQGTGPQAGLCALLERLEAEIFKLFVHHLADDAHNAIMRYLLNTVFRPEEEQKFY